MGHQYAVVPEPLIPRQWCPVEECGIGAPAGALGRVLLELVGGALELVVEWELDVVAALANAAPAATSAPVTASVVTRGLMR